ncbi:MAG: hypothetical protein Q7T81_06770 [Pseudolabrys sp.]|nr:hypothetical protein [Pseudolabrys sp.]
MTEILLGGGGARTAALSPIAQPRARSTAIWALAGIAMVLMLLSPALWNGFPLIFPDTGGYLDRPVHGTLGMGRSALYGAFLYPGVPFHFWPNIILQSAMMVWLIVLSLRTHGLGGRPGLALGIVALLTVATSAPWFAAQLMPDILFAAAALALHLLVFRSDALQRWERWTLAAVIVFAMPSHMALAGMCVGIVIALALLKLALKTWPALGLPQPRLTFAATAVAAGIAMCPVSNYAVTGQFALTPGGSSFLVGRLVEDGIVIRYLNDKCPDPTIRLCAFTASNFPTDADWWLWDGDSPFRKLQNFEGSAEEKALVTETMKLYPVAHFFAAVRASAEQMVKFATEISVKHNGPTIEMMRVHTPKLWPQLMQARQQVEKFDVGVLNPVHVPVAGFAMVCLVAALAFRQRLGLPPPLAAFAVSVMLALAANAVICGVFSHAVDRYQSRLVWLAPLAVAMIAAWLYRQRAEPAAN